MHSARFSREALEEALPAGGRIEDFADHSRLLAEAVRSRCSRSTRVTPAPSEMNWTSSSVISSGSKRHVLDALVGSLPTDVIGHTRTFFERNIERLKSALTVSSQMSEAKAKAYAIQILAALEGAMIISKSLGDEATF